MLHILERVHHVGDEAQAEGEAEDDEGPETVDPRQLSVRGTQGVDDTGLGEMLRSRSEGTWGQSERGDGRDSLGGISDMVADSRHASFAAAGAIYRRRTHAQVRDRRSGFELATIILSHAATAHNTLRHFVSHRPTLVLLWWRLAVHLLLLVDLLLVWIMLYHSWLLLIVHAVWLLVHHRLFVLLEDHRGSLNRRRGAARKTTHL